MDEMDEGKRAFSSFRVLNGEASSIERDKLFRNMAQLYSYVSDRCDDEQVAQYDEVLCQLAELVEVEARSHVAQLLAPLDRAPGNVVVKLANDEYQVAAPLLEFSNVLSDDDLIDIVAKQSEAHRVAIASRSKLTERVGEAIVEHGGDTSVAQLVRNRKAELGLDMLERLVARARENVRLAEDLRGRSDIDWKALRSEILSAGDKVLEVLGQRVQPVDPVTAGAVNAMVYNRMRNRAGFSSHDWKVAYNQVKALSDRKQLNERAMARFARFGYGHHTAAALAVQLKIAPEVMVKWLAMQDYSAVTVAMRALGVPASLFDAMIATMPWRDMPTEAEIAAMHKRFQSLEQDEATELFDLWRAHAFRRRATAEDRAAGAA
ncbi:hypothetical protein SAMN02983003_1349 [Devosia enhydra]|uniref:DUF2336 domain-containing protein n=1 Tax=Devosia enhydra TaxID=665118 RepID=A0A1K2HVT3_9HYPH|nr:DUF2336 domain-containing protein [Devosia enhydra]SFZ82917.1 hypothetical protein SAMN02983003_1349 [Devosia enhydra]